MGMAAFIATVDLTGTRLRRVVLVTLVSLSLVASLFHGCRCLDPVDINLTVSVAQAASQDSGKSSPAQETHCCHCLAHVTIGSPQHHVATIEYVTRLDDVVVAAAPDSADPGSPFKPPRA
jgi:hypothetical protein